jgi:hypothetical protein
MLMAAAGSTNDEIEDKLCLSNHAAIKWRGRFHAAAAELAEIEANSPNKLKKAVISVLSDAHRTGAKPRITDGHIAGIIALSLEDPQNLGYPCAHWTYGSLAAAAAAKGMAGGIFASQIRRYLKKRP